MNIKKILLISLIVVAIFVSVNMVSAGWFDGLFGEEQKDNIVEIDNITFNTTNMTNFTIYDNGTGWKQYESINESQKYTLWIGDYDEMDYAQQTKLEIQNHRNRLPSQSVNGVVVYTDSAKHGSYVGEPRYLAIIENHDLNQDIEIWSHNPNETAKIALSLKFR